MHGTHGSLRLGAVGGRERHNRQEKREGSKEAHEPAHMTVKAHSSPFLPSAPHKLPHGGAGRTNRPGGMITGLGTCPEKGVKNAVLPALPPRRMSHWTGYQARCEPL
ncbi:MAG: hypothetical protein BroJett024_06700 [Alphaproteobacteria bacterium]|nr:MAG: hypothetical protein BroJett024_06700 [Alphaproteobacteria bacterium]